MVGHNKSNRYIISFPIFILVVIFTSPIAAQSLEKKKHNQDNDSLHLYMDIHKNVEGLTAEGVIDAHKKDLALQDQYNVDYQSYWYDEETGTVFCLVRAPNKEAAYTVHKEAHGLVPDEIIEVEEGK